MSDVKKMFENIEVTTKHKSDVPKHYIVFDPTDKTEIEINGEKKTLYEWYQEIIRPLSGGSPKKEAIAFLQLVIGQTEKPKREKATEKSKQ